MSMDKLTGIKIKYENGTYSDEIPVGAFAVNVGWDSTHTLVDIIGDIDIATDGSLQDQIDALLANTYTDSYIATVQGSFPMYIDNAGGGTIKSITSDTTQVTVINKNLLNLDDFNDQFPTTKNGISFQRDTTSLDSSVVGSIYIHGAYTGSGLAPSESVMFARSDALDIFQPGETYTLSSGKVFGTTQIKIRLYDNMDDEYYDYYSKNNSRTFTVPSDIGQNWEIEFSWTPQDEEITVDETIYPMIELGNIATSYVASAQQTYSIGGSTLPVLYEGINNIIGWANGSNTITYSASKTIDKINNHDTKDIDTDLRDYLDQLSETFSVNLETGSIKIGKYSTAAGISSIAGGSGNSSNSSYASHNNSIAYGLGVKTGKAKQVVFGQYNTVDSGASLVIGVGTNNSTRANAFTAGNDTVNNYITIGTKKITDIDVGILKKLTPSRNLCVVDDAHLVKPDFWTGDWDGPWKNTKGFTCNQPSYLAAKGGGFWYHLQAGTYTFGCDVKYYQTTTTQVYYIFHFSPDSNPTALTDLTERILTEPLTPRIELTFTLPEAGTLIFRPTSYANSGGDYKTRYENVQIEVGNMATEYEPYRDYYTIGDALIATGSTAPTSTLTGNVYLANGYGYGPDGTTFSKFITKSDLTHDATNSAIIYTVPFLTYEDLGESSSTTLTSNLASTWLKYVVTNYGAEIGTRPVIGQLKTSSNFIATLVGSGTTFNTTNDYPTRSSFIATDGSAYTHRFYTFDGTFAFTDLISTFGGTLRGNLYMPKGYAYGADNSTFSRLVTEGQFGDLLHLFSGLPTLAATPVGVTTSASFSDYTQAWLKYICAHYSGIINATTYINNGSTSSDSNALRPIVAVLYPNSAYLCIGGIYNPSKMSNGLPQYSGFTAISLAGAAQYIYTFGTQDYTFSCRRVATSAAT